MSILLAKDIMSGHTPSHASPAPLRIRALEIGEGPMIIALRIAGALAVVGTFPHRQSRLT